MPEKSEKLVDYIFFADCHGLVSVIPWDKKEFSMLKISCHANPQRFPVYGTIPLTKCVYESLQDLIKTDDGRKIALNSIKEAKFNLPVEGLIHQLSNLERIPNDSLDPYWHDPKVQEKVSKIADKALSEVKSND